MKIGLALGSGSSRGWSHIGVINALRAQGIEPDIVCGTSIGSLVGASYVSNNLQKLEDWVCSLSKLETARFFEINSSLNGFVNTERLHGFLQKYVADDVALISSLNKKYASVATDLETGREVWLTEGTLLEAVWASIALPGLFPAINASVATDLETGREVWLTEGTLLEAVWASIALPGLFPAINNNNKWLVDGGLVNPVPISVCRALGADVVIAVNLNGDIVGKHFNKPPQRIKRDTGVVGRITDFVSDYTAAVFSKVRPANEAPGLFEAIAGSVNITQDRITRSRMAGDPPDILLSPKLAHIGLLEFYRANEAIAEGQKCVERMMPEINHVLNMSQ